MQIKINILLCVNILLGCKPPSDKCVFSSPTPHPPSLFLPFFPLDQQSNSIAAYTHFRIIPSSSVYSNVKLLYFRIYFKCYTIL